MVSQRILNQLDNCYSNRKNLNIWHTAAKKIGSWQFAELITSELKLIYYENSMRVYRGSRTKNQTNYQTMSSGKIVKQKLIFYLLMRNRLFLFLIHYVFWSIDCKRDLFHNNSFYDNTFCYVQCTFNAKSLDLGQTHSFEQEYFTQACVCILYSIHTWNRFSGNFSISSLIKICIKCLIWTMLHKFNAIFLKSFFP